MLVGLEVENNPLEEDIHRDTELAIVYEDDYLVVVDKPAGMLSVPGKNDLDSVSRRLRRLYPSATGTLVVHRLDMATSGLLLAAKNLEVQRQLQALFETRAVKKRYTALLEGEPLRNEGIISLPLIPDLSDRPRQRVDYEHGKPAVTRYQVIGRRGQNALVSFYPETGRTHQLRVHACTSGRTELPDCRRYAVWHESRPYVSSRCRTCFHPSRKRKRDTYRPRSRFLVETCSRSTKFK